MVMHTRNGAGTHRHRRARAARIALSAVVIWGAVSCAGLDGGGGETGGEKEQVIQSAAADPAFLIIDLTEPLSPDAPYFPGAVPFTVDTLSELVADGYYSRKFTMGEHTGTHVDAPGHFVPGAGLMDTLQPRDLIAPLVVIDVHAQCAANPDFVLDMTALDAWELTHGPVPDGAVVALATGWDQRGHDLQRYRNTDADGIMHFPGFSAEAATFLAVQRSVRALGIDTLSTDPGRSQDFAQHKAFLAHGTYQIENLRNLDKLPPTGATIVVGVLPIRDGSGAPARVFAIVPRGTP